MYHSKGNPPTLIPKLNLHEAMKDYTIIYYFFEIIGEMGCLEKVESMENDIYIYTTFFWSHILSNGRKYCIDKIYIYTEFICEET